MLHLLGHFRDGRVDDVLLVEVLDRVRGRGHGLGVGQPLAAAAPLLQVDFTEEVLREGEFGRLPFSRSSLAGKKFEIFQNICLFL